MEEIKLRIWDKQEKEIFLDFPYDNLKIDHFYNRVDVMQKILIDPEKLKVKSQQIFEKDIIKCKADDFDGIGIGYIEYSEEFASFSLIVPYNGQKWSYPLFSCHQIEVIGNIYENPELIELEE